MRERDDGRLVDVRPNRVLLYAATIDECEVRTVPFCFLCFCLADVSLAGDIGREKKKIHSTPNNIDI